MIHTIIYGTYIILIYLQGKKKKKKSINTILEQELAKKFILQ